LAEHWLSRITELFTSNSDDLVELASIAGYDPREFYHGTLTADQIDNLLRPADKREKAAGFFQITGDLGEVAAWLPADFDVVTVRVRVFSNEIAVLEAFLSGKLRHDTAALIAEGPYPKYDGDVYSPGLELLRIAGGRPMLLFSGQLSKLKATVPVLCYSDARNSPSARYGVLTDGDVIKLHRDQLRLELKQGAGDWNVTEDKLSSVTRGKPQGEVTHQELQDVLGFEVDLLEKVLSLHAESRQRRLGVRPFVLAFALLAESIQRLLQEIAAIDSTHQFFHRSDELHLLMDLLWRSAVIARRAGYSSSALRIHDTQLRIVERFREVFAETWVQTTADIQVAIGDLYSRSNKEIDAIAAYAEAHELLRHESSGRAAFPAQAEIAEVLHKLSVMSGKIDRQDEEEEYAELAVRAIGDADHVFADRAFLELKGKVLFEKAKMDFRGGRIYDALRECDRAIEAYLRIRKERTYGVISLKAAAAYRLKSDILWRLDEHHDGVVSRVAALHLVLDYLDNAETQRSGMIGLEKLAQDAQALKDHLFQLSPLLDDGPRRGHVLDIAWSILRHTEIDPDVSSDRSWLYHVKRLGHELEGHLPAQLMRQV